MKVVLVGGVFLFFCLALHFELHAQQVLFDRQVLPILTRNCFPCHGPDEASREADLRLDQQLDQLVESEIVVPGFAEKSQLFLRVSSSDPELRMPPPDSEQQLTAEEIEIIRRWINEGAHWTQHWAFVPPTKQPLPDVTQSDWCQTPIDYFVLARLEQESFHPSPPAGRRTLIRRLSLDLTGLPPTLAEVEHFLADDSQQAYEHQVDRLLTSPRYGEHMARYWLDAARFADTHGLHIDNYREIWPYRDYVIRAFNSNLPYDQFLVEQLAGDLLPDANLDQQVASGFNRCHVTTNEGGSITEEVYVRNVVDRVSTLGTAMMGLTLGCCVCHDHKFDPFTQQDFYQLFAFFNSLDGQEMDGNTKHPAPYVRVPSSEQRRELASLQNRMDSLEQENARRVEAFATKNNLEEIVRAPQFFKGLMTCEPREGLHHCVYLQEANGASFRDSVASETVGKLHGTVDTIAGLTRPALRFQEDGYADLADAGILKEDHAFSLLAWVNLPETLTGTILAKMDVRDLEKGYRLGVEQGRVVMEFNGRWPGYAIHLRSSEPVIRTNEWQQIAVTYDGHKLASGFEIYVDGKPIDCKVVCDSLHQEGSTDAEVPLQIGRRDKDAPYAGLTMDEVRIYDRRLREDEVRALSLLPYAKEILSHDPETWCESDTKVIAELAALTNDPTYRETALEIDQLRLRQAELMSRLTTTPVFRELLNPQPAYLLIRGEYDQHGKEVNRATPAALPVFDPDLPRDRLGLARWLTADNHPLTSRVAVNRFWQQLFGIGIVETSEDFGIQGTPPSHPELLDWLACEFRDSGWDVKKLVKLIVMSATYQQSSDRPASEFRRDPKNRLLARGPRFRLDAEVLRDQALAVTGLLVNQVGGPSVKPPQPDGLWKAVAFLESDTARFQADHGPEKVHRRSLYTFWKRTAPPPEMGILDAPSREACTVRRERTNTPLQALMLMNDPQYFEAARAFAERIMKEPTGSPKARLRWAVEQVVLRPPEAAELGDLVLAYEDFVQFYQDHPDAAKDVIQVGEEPPDEELKPTELATWCVIANTLLNLDEFITKE